jgi:hypothetical protein
MVAVRRKTARKNRPLASRCSVRADATRFRNRMANQLLDIIDNPAMPIPF